MYSLRNRKVKNVRQSEILPLHYQESENNLLYRLDLKVMKWVTENVDEFPLFSEWYQDHFRYYGPRIKPGFLGLLWLLSDENTNGDLSLDWDKFSQFCDEKNSQTNPFKEYRYWAGATGRSHILEMIDIINDYKVLQAEEEVSRWQRKKRQKEKQAKRREELASRQPSQMGNSLQSTGS